VNPTTPFLTLLRGVVLIVGVLLCSGCHPSHPPSSSPRIATTTSYLEAAARDLLGDELQVLRLAEPGTCPGHFDIRPSQVAELGKCRALVRFDFQKSLDTKLVKSESQPLPVAEIILKEGMCRPSSYLTACQQVASHLVQLDLLSRTNADARVQAISSRLDALSRDATNKLAATSLTQAPVIASAHQRDFCDWLGLKVVATFRAADTASIAEIEKAIDTGTWKQVKLIIANLPEGRRTADALAERLKARVVVFENFPGLRDGQVSFDAMFRTNLEALLQAAAP
jgi:ABC-type Zn uptake system ZnuABC Zn-binding protein ZnuA